MESKVVLSMMLVIMTIFNFLPSSLGATNFCLEPLGMERTIILNEQITESSIFNNELIRKGYNARLNNYHCWCPTHGSTLSQQWVKVDLRYPMSIRGITIQGDRGYPPNYIKKFKLSYSTDGTSYLYKTADADGLAEEFTGATGQDQTIHRMFNARPFAARYVEFRPTAFNGNDACVRFELYGCAYVCNQGLGIEAGNSLPSGFKMASSSNQNGNAATSARLNAASSCWCASTNDGNQYLQIDFGKPLTVTGLAIQGNPTADSWVKDFYFDYGMSLGSLVTYQEYGTNKLFVGNMDRNTKVVNWFKVRLFSRYVRIKPNTRNGGICMRVEIIGCNSEPVYEVGAENRALSDSRFTASAYTDWQHGGRYRAHDGRLNSDRPWSVTNTATDPWFKVDLGRVMLVNGISTQGDSTFGPNYYSDYKLQYSFDAAPAVAALFTIKEEIASSEKVFTGNTNNAGVKFNFLAHPISTRHVQFRKNTAPRNVYTLRVEMYGQPQTCATSFGMEAGSQSTYNPTVQVSSGSIPLEKSKLNSPTAWCAGGDNVNQYFGYDFGGIRTISGFAIQGHPVDLKWVKTFNVEHKQLQSEGFTTYQESGTNKAFVGCTSRNLIVYHWFSSNLRVRYLRIKPLTWNTNICLRMNAYGCPSDDCFNKLGISSNAIGNAAISSSSHASSREGHKGRLNMESVWEANESGVSKPWIQVCLSSVHKVTSIVVQGPGSFDNLAKVAEFSLSFGTSSLGSFQDYSIDSTVKKFAVSIGRYTSSQIDLPFAIVSKCIRLQVESKSPTNQNVGLRWELLGCTTTPQISSLTITPASPSGAKNSTIVLSCNVNALPGADVTWKKGAIILSNGGIYEVGSTTYSTGSSQVTKSLKITATVSTVVTSFQCSVTAPSQGLAECKQSYECSAVIGGVSSTTQSSTTEVKVTGLQAKPSKPTGLSPSSLTTSSFSVTWTAATAADFAIIDYKAVIKKKSDNTVVRTIASIASTATLFSGLTTFTTYIVEISAQSSFSVFSDAATLEITTEQGVPTAPLSLSATAVSSTSIQLSWNRPSTLNGILHDYKVRYKLLSDSNFGTPISAGTQLTYNAIGLKPFTDYELQVQATTKGGVNEGPWSSSISSKTLEGASTAPLNLSATAISATSIRLTWNQPTSFNGILHEYKVRYKLASDTTYGSPFGTGRQLNYIVNNLKPYSNYELQVHASTKGGNISGIWSSTAESRTLEGLPSEPQNLTVLETKLDNVLIRWAKPMTENGVVQTYTVRFIGSKTYNVSFTQRGDMTVPRNASSESTSLVVRNLVPGTDYRIEVAATTGGGTGNFSSVIKFATPYAAPPKPTIQYQSVSKTVRKLLLGHASNINGPISKYQLFIVEGQAQPCLPNGLNKTIDPLQLPLTFEIEAGVKLIKGLSLEMETIGYFNLCYYAVIQEKNQSFLSEAATLDIERKSLPKVDPSPYNSTIKESSFVIPLVLGPSATKNYHIIVMEGSVSAKSAQEWLPSELGPYDTATYKAGKPYVAAVLPSYKPIFTVGDGTDSVSSNRKRRNVGSVTYRNVPLKASTDYLVFQRAYVSQREYYSSPWNGPLKTKQADPITTTPPTPPPIGLIVGIVVAVVIILALGIVVFVFYRKRKAPGKDIGAHKKPMMMSPIAQSSENASYNDDEDEATNVESSPTPPARTHSILERRRSSTSSLRHKKAPRSVGHDSRHPAISLEDFARHSKDLQRDSHHGITVEYEDLGKGQQYTWDIAVNANNKKKNRYANIAAYDHSRVKLNPIRGVPHSDYFNANYISGYERDAVYIASQGPIDSVLGDFWRMIWDANVSAIVMLTNLVERGKKKCSQYWPDMESVAFEEVTIHLTSVESYVDYTIRCFSITRSGFKDSRTVYQYHYTTWPDHGIPESPTDLLNLQRKLRKTFPFSLDAPIVVHCSAGVGRTGTFIVIDAMLHLLRSQRKIDVFNYLNFIRTQRIHMVQVEEQYLFIYKALLESVTCGMTEIETQNLRIRINQLSTKEKSNQTGFDKQFQRLMMVTPQFNEKETSTALSKSNVVRNRKSSIVPREISRVILQQSIYENDGSTDYINALYVNGYKRKNAFIATQHPLPNTINDFWAMIYQANVTTFVLLNKAQAGKENLPVFWPEVEQETMFGNTVVRSEQEQMTADSVERDFVVSHRDTRANERYVKMFQFTNWPDHSVPKECGKLLALINKVEKCQQQQNEDQPIVVMCSDGAGRTGTFIAINILLERFKTEQLIDVFQTIKKIRAFRPEFVENSFQYKFCHSVVQEYMESFDAYSNFNG